MAYQHSPVGKVKCEEVSRQKADLFLRGIAVHHPSYYFDDCTMGVRGCLARFLTKDLPAALVVGIRARIRRGSHSQLRKLPPTSNSSETAGGPQHAHLTSPHPSGSLTRERCHALAHRTKFTRKPWQCHAKALARGSTLYTDRRQGGCSEFW